MGGFSLRVASVSAQYKSWNSACTNYGSTPASTYHYGYNDVYASAVKSRIAGASLEGVYASEALYGATASNWPHPTPTTSDAPTSSIVTGDALGACPSVYVRNPTPVPYSGVMQAKVFSESQQGCSQGTGAASPSYGTSTCTGTGLAVQNDTQTYYVDEGTVTFITSPPGPPPQQ
jgi:hypothetical protein